MRIQNNITAMNTHRMYTINNDNVAKAAEKLSSGYRINRAGDDAAGLAISEKMRSQIRGLNMATKNSQDAISLVQTAEGALQETHSMLQRMNELAVQAATGTNEDFDRNALAKEFEQLKREINDVAEQTNFNNMKILDGSLSYEGYVRSAATAGVNMTVATDTKMLDPAITFTTTPAEAAAAGAKAENTIDTATAFGQTEAEHSYKIEIQINGETVKLMNAAGNATDGKFTNDDGSEISACLDGYKIETKDGKIFTLSDSSGKLKLQADDNFDWDWSTTDVQINLYKHKDSDVAAGNDNWALAGSVTADKTASATVKTGVAARTGNTAKVETKITIDQDKIVNGDTLTIGGKTYTFYAKAGSTGTPPKDYGLDADGNKVLADANSTSIIFDSEKPNDAAAQLLAKLNGANTKPTSASGGTIAAATASGSTITISGTGKAATANANDPLKVYNEAQANADKITQELTPEYKTNSSKESTKTTIEFDIAKMKDGDQFTINVGGKKISIAEFKSTDTRDGFMKKVADAATKAGIGEVKGNALIIKDQKVDGIDLKWNEELNKDTNAIRIQVGANEHEQLSVSIDSMNTKGLGLDDATLLVAGASTTENQDSAGKAITAVKTAINKVSDQRATLGAMQNRLEHKIANLKVSSENLSAAESRIRDVDMASEMTNFTKNNILSQAATAMLAQANSLPQNVLSLLG